MSEPIYKVLGENGEARMGTGSWPLPNGRPGKWMHVKGDLVPCQHGLHLCELSDLLCWLGPRIFRAEAKGKKIRHGNKWVVRSARLIEETNWNARTQRLFACDCAEHVLSKDADPRSWKAIEVARRYANGEATDEELLAARSAAWLAAWSAESAVWSAAGSAAALAAESAARAAALAAESAAWAADAAEEPAAWSAAGTAAATAAESAAWLARSAAWSAAWSAAASAERKWQAQRLRYYLDHNKRGQG